MLRLPAGPRQHPVGDKDAPESSGELDIRECELS